MYPMNASNYLGKVMDLNEIIMYNHLRACVFLLQLWHVVSLMY